MTRAYRRSWTDTALPLAAVVLIGAGLLLPRLDREAPAAEPTAQWQSTFVCPSAPGVSTSLGQLAPGDERRVVVTRKGNRSDKASDAKRWTVDSFGRDGAIVVQDGRASGAVGFTSQVAPRASGGGLSVARCGSIIDEAWFLGLATADKRASTLVLTNLSNTPAVADITLWNKQGKVDAVRADGVSIKPFTIRRIPISDLAAGEPDLVMQVIRRRGVMAASVEDQSTATFAGNEVIDVTAGPSNQQYLAGLDGGSRGKTLLLMNPDKQVARVDVTMVTADGPVADEKLQSIKLTPGEYRSVAIPPSIGSGGHTAVVVSDRPVVAAARVEPDVKDYSVVEPTEPLTGPAIVPLQLGKGVAFDRLILTAFKGSAKVEIATFDANMKRIDTTTISLKGLSTSALDKSKIDGLAKAAYLTVSVNGDVVGAATYRAGTGVSSLSLQSAPTTIDVPAVLPD